MKAKSAYYALLGTMALVIVASIGAVVYANHWLKTRTSSLISLKTETIKLQQERATYLRAKVLLEKYKDVNTTLQKIIPKSKDQANAVSELLAIAKDDDIVLNSITFPSSDLGAKTTTKTTVTPSTTTATPSAAPTTAPTPAAPAVTQGKTVDGISGILGIAVNVSNITRVGGAAADGIKYDQVINFLKSLERNRRTMQVTSVQIQPIKDAKTGAITGYGLTLTLNIFVKP